MCYVTKHSKPQLKLEKNIVIFQVVRSKQIDAWTILEKQNRIIYFLKHPIKPS